MTIKTDLKNRAERLKAVPPIAYLMALSQRFGRDNGSYLAATITYFGFLSLFPLILLGLSIIGFVLVHDPQSQAFWTDRLARAVPGLGPIIGKNIASIVRHRRGTGIVGVLGLAWSGIQVIEACEYALGTVHRVTARQPFVKAKSRALLILASLGGVAMASVAIPGLIGGLASRGTTGVVLGVVGTIAALLLDFTLFIVSYRLLVPGAGPPWSTLWRGAVFAAVGWTALKLFGALYVSRTVAGAAAVYGSFAAVVGMLALLFMASRLFVYGAEINALSNRSPGAETNARSVETPRKENLDMRDDLAGRKREIIDLTAVDKNSVQRGSGG